MNPRIEVLLDGEHVLGLIEGEEMLEAGQDMDGRYRICPIYVETMNFELALLYAECIKAVIEKCNELQDMQE